MWYDEYREHLLGDEWLQEKRPGYIVKNTDWNALFNLNRAQGNNSEETLAAMLDDFFGESVDGIRVGGRFEDIADALDDINDKIEELENHSVFICTENVTTFEEAKEAFEAGRFLVGTDNGEAYYRLDYYDGLVFIFVATNEIPQNRFLILDSEEGWSSGVVNLQTKIDANNKLPAAYIDGQLGAVDSVNGKTGDVVLAAEDVGALTEDDVTELLAGKQDAIADLVTIRSGSAAGATAYQKPAQGIPASDLEETYVDMDVIDDISAKIPSEASSVNKLVTVTQMSSAIAAVEAKQVYATAAQGSFATKAALVAATTFYNADGTVATPTKNDVAYVLADESHDGKTTKYVIAKVVGASITWGFVIAFAGGTFSDEQMAAINSGATAAKISSYNTHVGDSDIHVTSAQKSTWNAKQDAIADLTTIRSGAASGATAYQKPGAGIPYNDLSAEVKNKFFSGDYSDLTNAPEIHDAFYCTYGSTTFAQISAAIAAGLLPVCVYGDRFYVYVGLSNGYHCFTSIITDSALRLYVKNTWGSSSYTVAKTTDLPTEATVSGWGFTKNTGTYSKPDDGIPASDLAAGVIPTGAHVQWTTISTTAITTGTGSIANYSNYDYIMVKGTVSGGARQWAIFPSFLFGQATTQSDSYSFTIADQDDAWFGYIYHTGTTGYIKHRGRSNNSGKIETIYGGKITLDF